MAGVMIPGITVRGIIRGTLRTGTVLIIMAGAVSMPAGILRGMTAGARLTDGAGEAAITEVIMAAITEEVITEITITTANRIIVKPMDVREQAVRMGVIRAVTALPAPVLPYQAAVHRRVPRRAEVLPYAAPVIQDAVLL